MERITVVLQRIAIFAPNHKGGFVQLFISKRLIHGLAGAMTGMFLPIFLYEVSGGQFWLAALYSGGASIGYVLLLVPGMKFTNLIGFSRALAIGAWFSIAVYATLYFMDADNYLTYIWLALIAGVGSRLFHWVPYHVDFTVFTSGGGRGRDVSLMFATVAFMGMIGPVLGGYIVANSGYDVLFGVTLVLLAMASISYLFVPAVEEKFTWSFGETWNNFFSKRYRSLVVSELANGAEVAVTLVAWPIFLFEVLDGNVLEVGFLSAVIVLATVVIQLLVGKYLDSGSDNKITTLKRGSLLYAIGWIAKIFVLSTVQVFLIGLYHNITRIFMKTPYNAILYDMSGEQGHFVDEFTVIKEMASHVGRALSFGMMIVLTLYVSVEWTFIIAAVASLLVNAIYRVRH